MFFSFIYYSKSTDLMYKVFIHNRMQKENFRITSQTTLAPLLTKRMLFEGKNNEGGYAFNTLILL